MTKWTPELFAELDAMVADDQPYERRAAERYGVPLGTVKSWVHEGRKRGLVREREPRCHHRCPKHCPVDA